MPGRRTGPDRLKGMSTTPAAVDSDVQAPIADRRAGFPDDLREWLRIPAFSAGTGSAPQVRRGAGWPADRHTATGFPVTGIRGTDGAPAVSRVGPSGDPGAPTVLVHGPHDVRPAAPEDASCRPLRARWEDGRLYGSGAVRLMKVWRMPRTSGTVSLRTGARTAQAHTAHEPTALERTARTRRPRERTAPRTTAPRIPDPRMTANNCYRGSRKPK
jgi:hypothetical protein